MIPVSPASDGNFNLISLQDHNTAFVIAVAGGTGAADDLVTAGLEFVGQFVDPFPAAHRECDMHIARTVQGLCQILQPGS